LRPAMIDGKWQNEGATHYFSSGRISTFRNSIG
jgi:hypothetical protein